MIEYDQTQDPAAPVLEVTLSGVRRAFPQRKLLALIDTGADVSAIPSSLVTILQLYTVGRIQIEGVDAEKSIFELFAVKLTLNGITISRLEVIATDLDFVVIGRDVLNQFYLLLNGPDGTFDLKKTPFISTSL